jgi:DNA processing protein
MDEISQELRCQLALHLVPGLGPRLTAALLEKFGSAAAVFQATPAQLQEIPHLGVQLADELSQALHRSDVTAELDWMARERVSILVRGTLDYPRSLENIPGAPQLLYIRGSLAPADANAVALVGSRQCSAYGRRVTERFATDLVRAGFTVVSGLARGIDGVAHRMALDKGGRTIAVLAGGLSKIYPPEHKELADDLEKAGAILTEAPMGMQPLAQMFPARNRIISGLSRAVVIVEAASRSGALITASHAADQGRPVFAVPGPLDSPSSEGTHELVRKGAILIRGVEDILEELDGIRAVKKPAPAAPPRDLDDVERRIWDFLEEGPRHVDEMAQQLALGIPEISRNLLMLEMKKLVRRLPGNQYERR